MMNKTQLPMSMHRSVFFPPAFSLKSDRTLISQIHRCRFFSSLRRSSSPQAPRSFSSAAYLLLAPPGAFLSAVLGFGVSSLYPTLKVFGFMPKRIRTPFLTMFSYVSALQHLGALIRVLRWISISSYHPERVSPQVVSRSHPFLSTACDL